jgi:hypothetical protein
MSIATGLERRTDVAALFHSLVASAKLAGVEPDAHLPTAARDAVRAEQIPHPHNWTEIQRVGATTIVTWHLTPTGRDHSLAQFP